MQLHVYVLLIYYVHSEQIKLGFSLFLKPSVVHELQNEHTCNSLLFMNFIGKPFSNKAYIYQGFKKKKKKETSFQFYEQPFNNMVFVILVIYQNTFKYMYISMH